MSQISQPRLPDAVDPAVTPEVSTPLDEARRAFFGLEAEYGLFDREVDGCRIWDYLRVEVFDRLISVLELLGEKQAPVQRNARAYLKETKGIARSVFLRNPYTAGPVEVLFLGHPRRRLEADGKWWDAYCDPVAEGIVRPHLLVERPFHNRHREPARTARIAHLDALALGAAMLRTCQRPLGRISDTAFFQELEVTLLREFGAVVPVEDMARAKLALRRSQLPLWRRLLRRLRPRVMFLVVSYGNEIPIEACKQLGIPTIELQHGVISRQNLGYHFPIADCRKQVFPDWLFAFGDFWRTAASFPIPADRVRSVGFPYLEARRGGDRGEDSGAVVFLSQRSIGTRLSQLAIDVAKGSKLEGEVIYKLHPGERSTWRSDYPWLVDGPVRVLDGDDPELYELFRTARAQIGVYSTALFEGLAFGLSTGVAQLPGHEVMRDFVDTTPSARWIRDADDVIDVARRPRADNTEDADRFFRPGAIGNLQEALDEVLATSAQEVKS